MKHYLSHRRSLTGSKVTTTGRSLAVGGEKLHVRGVTYGTFADGAFPPQSQVEQDFTAMAANGFNAVRTYTAPPRWLLDVADAAGLHVMAATPWEQHVTFLDNPRRANSIRDRVAAAVEPCAGHPALLCWAIGNEIPASIARWHGRHRIERFLERLYRTVKAEDPDSLVTYVNYPSTEYLDLSFTDLVCFNVFLESEEAFDSYLARLQNIAGNRPLLVTEAGLDSRRNGEDAQADALAWQIRRSFATGAAGVFVFSWTDEWHRGGADIADWDFGIVDRERRPKRALTAVRDAFSEAPFPGDGPWSRISVVVCSHDGERTLERCLDRVRALRYPDFELIVVNDGSGDATAEIARQHDARLIDIDHAGLGAARNQGLRAATGEIIAYLDDDAHPDPDWLYYLAAAFADGSYAAVGGPNIPPPDQTLVASCVAGAPGGPTHVLVTDREAEHVPGCNMAFRKSILEKVGGFDPRFRVAGDDVDICWRLQEAGFTVGFSAGAVVLHERRSSVRSYVRQQYEYGKAETLLARKWPSRYNRGGYLRWTGRIYGRGGGPPVRARSRRIHYGQWGTALFQSVYQPAPSLLSSVVLMPESYVVLAALAMLSLLSLLWSPLLFAIPVLALGGSAVLLSALAGSGAQHAAAGGGSRLGRTQRRALTALLSMLQPAARLAGRARLALAPGRRRVTFEARVPRPRTVTVWSERWRSHESRLSDIERGLIDAKCAVRTGGPFDRWDFEVRTRALGTIRLRTTLEEHGRGRQLLRVRAWPHVRRTVLAAFLALVVMAVGAWADDAMAPAALMSVAALSLAGLALRGFGVTMGMSLCVVEEQVDGDERDESDPVLAGVHGPLDSIEAELSWERARRRGNGDVSRGANGGSARPRRRSPVRVNELPETER